MIQTRQELADLLHANQGVIFIKWGAEWCGPCRAMQPQLNHWRRQLPPDCQLLELDADQDTELYAHFRSKRLAKSLPTLLQYNKGNERLETPDGVVIGNHLEQINRLFMEGITNKKA